MQIALNHPATPAGPHRLPFLLVITDDLAGGTEDVSISIHANGGDRASPPLVEAVANSSDEDLETLYDEECERADLLEQKLASALMLLRDTAAERDRWHQQAQSALSLADSLQRQLDALRRPLRIVTPRRKPRRFFGLF